MKKKILNILQKRKEHLDLFLTRSGKIKDAVPKVQEMKERTDLDIAAIQDMPDDAIELYDDDFCINNERINEALFTKIPIPDEIETYDVDSTSSVITSGSTGAFTRISWGLEIDDDLIYPWAETYVPKYIDMQEQLSTYTQTKAKLMMFSIDLTDELEVAHQKYRSVKAKIEDEISFGIAARNILEHFKGELQQKSKTHVKENTPSWESMSERLVGKSPNSVEVKEMIEQKKEWGELHDDLTKIAKKQRIKKPYDVERIWVRLVNHIYVVLGLINLSE